MEEIIEEGYALEWCRCSSVKSPYLFCEIYMVCFDGSEKMGDLLVFITISG